jgi:transposase
MNWLKENKINVLNPWPARSPDLNVIELLWARMANNVSKRGPSSSEELAAMVKDEWEKIPQAEIDHLVGEEYRKRIQACIAVGGRTLTRQDVRNQAF